MVAGRDLRRASDGELLRRCESDPEAFREIYRRHERVVVAFLARRTRNAEMAADLAAETFARALLNARRFNADGDEPAIGWLLGIARHTWLHTLERGRNERTACERLGIELPAMSDASLERIEAFIDAEHPDNPLLALLEQLPAQQREAVRAHVLEERPYDEVAEHLGVSQETVRQRVSRGLTRLRRTLKEEAR